MALPSLQTTLKDWRMEVAKGTIVDHQAVTWRFELGANWWTRECRAVVPLYPDRAVYCYAMTVTASSPCQLTVNGNEYELPRGQTQLQIPLPLPLGQTWDVRCQWKGWWPWQRCVFNTTLILVQQ